MPPAVPPAMTDAARPALLLTGSVMEDVVERQLSGRFTLLPLDALDDTNAGAVQAIATRG